LLKEIRAPDLMAEDTLNRTRVGVSRASHGEQVPWISSSLAEDFAFAPGASGASAKVQTPTPSTINPPSPQQPAPGKADVASNANAVSAPVTSAGASQRGETPTELALADDPTIKALTTKIATNPDDINALYRRGQVYANKGAYTLALRDFDDTLRINPKDVEALNHRCWTRTITGELQGALKDCNEALRLRPSFVEALDSRGLLNLKAGAFKNAIADFDAALKLNPRLTSSLYGRGLAKQRSGCDAEGAVDIANAKAMDPNIAQEFASYGVR
jgi:Flp pilus assembly protein TadD